jgi:hypothetical protein
MICGIIGIFPFCLIAVIIGHISISEIRQSAGRLTGRGLAITGLILGYLGLVTIPLIVIAAASLMPNLFRARISASEVSAAVSVREIVTAEINYQTSHPQTGFTCNLSDLSPLIDSDLVSGQKGGYVFTLQNCTAAKEGDPISKYQVTAAPTASDRKAFCADEVGVTRMDRGGSPQGCLDHGTFE